MSLLNFGKPNSGVPVTSGLKVGSGSEPPIDRRVDPTQALNLSGPIITISVGEAPNTHTMSVHEDLLTSRSEYFKRATNEKWLEYKEGIGFPEGKLNIFQCYINLVYTGQLATKTHDFEDEYTTLIELYVLAEKFQDTQAKNDIIDAMLHKSRIRSVADQLPYMKDINYLYDGTMEGSKARKLLVDLYVDYGEMSMLHSNDEIPGEFLHDLSSRLLQLHSNLRNARTCTTKSCSFSDYHEGQVEGTAIATTATPNPKKKAFVLPNQDQFF